MTLGGAFLKKLNWTSVNNPTQSVEIDDCISMTINKSTEIKNNLLTMTLKNSPVQYDGNSNAITFGKYINPATYENNFSQFDEFMVYLKLTDDASEIDSSTWIIDDNLAGRFLLQETAMDTTENTAHLTLKAVDAAFFYFNAIFNFTFGAGNNFTSPGAIRWICRQFAEKTTTTITSFQGTHNDAGVYYIVDAKFVSEGGNIADYRSSPSTLLNGSINNSATTINVDSTAGYESTNGTLVIDTEHIAYTGLTATSFTGCTRGIDDTTPASHSDNAIVHAGFPLIAITKSWSALFDWFPEISQTNYTNYLDEQQAGGNLFYNRAFMFWLDNKNSPHWFFPSDDVDLDISLSEEGRRSFRLQKSVFDSINFVIYNTGEDMYGNGNIYYLYDETANVNGLKMRYQPMTKIIQTLVDADIKINGTRDTTKTQDKYKQFPTSGSYPLSSWGFKTESNSFRASLNQSARTSIANDTEYNDSLREAAKWTGLAQAKKITKKQSGLRYKGQIALKGQIVNPGDLIRVTNWWTGQNQKLIRVINVTHSINANSWESTLEVEEDDLSIIQSVY